MTILDIKGIDFSDGELKYSTEPLYSRNTGHLKAESFVNTEGIKYVQGMAVLNLGSEKVSTPFVMSGNSDTPDNIYFQDVIFQKKDRLLRGPKIEVITNVSDSNYDVMVYNAFHSIKSGEEVRVVDQSSQSTIEPNYEKTRDTNYLENKKSSNLSGIYSISQVFDVSTEGYFDIETFHKVYDSGSLNGENYVVRIKSTGKDLGGSPIELSYDNAKSYLFLGDDVSFPNAKKVNRNPFAPASADDLSEIEICAGTNDFGSFDIKTERVYPVNLSLGGMIKDRSNKLKVKISPKKYEYEKNSDGEHLSLTVEYLIEIPTKKDDSVNYVIKIESKDGNLNFGEGGLMSISEDGKESLEKMFPGIRQEIGI